MGRTSVLLADGHRMLLDCLAAFLEQDFQILGSVCDGLRLIELARRKEPEVIVMEVAMPSINGIDAIRILQKSSCASKILILSKESDFQIVQQAFQAGASGFLLKTSDLEELWAAIESVAKGRMYIASLLAGDFVFSLLHPSRQARSRVAAMSMRERRLVQLLAEGSTVKAAAAAMAIPTRTAESDKREVMRRVGAHNVKDLIRYAVRLKLV
jgi:DNA-binding NarL/FixJ family response regulator